MAIVMEPPPALYVYLSGKTLGPLNSGQVRELVEGGVVTGKTYVATPGASAWVRAEAVPWIAEMLPQRAQFGFKAAIFEKANRESAAPVDHRELIAIANQPRQVGPPVARGPELKPADAWENDVVALRRLNLAKENALGLNELPPPPPRRSRRTRDYIVLMAGLALVIFPILGAEAFLAAQVQTLAAGMPDQFWPLLKTLLFHSPILWWGLAGWLIMGFAFAWLMFGVLDDY
jgi:hypothetical protein